MIVFTNVELTLLAQQGKNFQWKKPCSCPRCNHESLWGHGFVTAIFNGFKEPLFLKRFRCNRCGLVMTIRPKGFWSRFQSSITLIYQAIMCRLSSLCWPKFLTRQRGGQWIKRYLLFIRSHYGENNEDQSLTDRLTILFEREVIFLAKLS
jgi:hypothetical protein